MRVTTLCQVVSNISAATPIPAILATHLHFQVVERPLPFTRDDLGLTPAGTPPPLHQTPDTSRGAHQGRRSARH